MLRKVQVERPGEFQAMAISRDAFFIRVSCETVVLDRTAVRTLAEALKHGKDCYIIANTNTLNLDESGLSVGICKAHVSTGILEDLLFLIESEGLA